MTWAELAQIITALAVLGTMLVGVWNAWRLYHVQKTITVVTDKVDVVQSQTNGMMAHVEKLAKESGHAAGVADEKAAGRSRKE